VSVSSPQLLAERFGVDETVLPEGKLPEHEADYNVTPRAQVLVVRERRPRPDNDAAAEAAESVRVLSLVRWGLVPSWAKDLSMGDRMINARCESVASKPAFRRAFGKRRCIVPADAFYEWKKVGEQPEREQLDAPGRAPARASSGRRAPRQPYCIRRRDGEPLAFAGLWEIWRDPAVADADAPDAWVRSCTIITTRANGVLAPIHDRMPVVLDEESWDEWLDPANHDLDALGALLVPAPDEWVEAYPVSTRVNSPRNNDADLVTQAEPETLLEP
jgi:putative SOS response-associated peptidase YedK